MAVVSEGCFCALQAQTLVRLKCCQPHCLPTSYDSVVDSPSYHTTASLILSDREIVFIVVSSAKRYILITIIFVNWIFLRTRQSFLPTHEMQ